MRLLILLVLLSICLNIHAQPPAESITFDHLGLLLEGKEGRLYRVPTEDAFNELIKRVEALEGTTAKLSEEDWLLANATSVEFITATYNKNNTRKRGYSTKDIAALFLLPDDGSEIEIAKRIYERIQLIRLLDE